GVRGGLAMGGLEATLAVGWWFDKGQPGTETWVVLRSLTYVLIGVVVGRVADSRAALLARVAHHNELSLDLIATASFEGRFTRVNPAFSKTLGFTSDELTSRPLMDF